AQALRLLPPRSPEERALDRWAGTLRVNVVPSSTVLLLESRSAQPAAAERLLHSMLDLYLEDHRAAFGARGLSPILDGYVSDREKALAAAEQQLTELRTRLGVVDVVQEVTELEKRRGDTATEVGRLAGALAAARARSTV